MNSNISKIKTYIGFAIKSRDLKFGVDDIVKMKAVKLIIASSTLAESSLAKLNKFAAEKKLEVTVLDKELFSEIMQSENIKAVAISNTNLAEAIKNNLTNF